MDSSAASQIAGSSNIVQTPTKGNIQGKGMNMESIVILHKKTKINSTSFVSINTHSSWATSFHGENTEETTKRRF